MHRRSFLSFSAGMGASAMLAGCVPMERPVPLAAQRRWGLMLYTVMNPLEQDFEGTLRAVAKAGYREVETLGSFGRDPVYVRTVLDKFGLSSPSQHISTHEIYSSFLDSRAGRISNAINLVNYANAFAIERVPSLMQDAIASAVAMGQQYVVWPIVLPVHIAERATLEKYIELFNLAGKMCADAGVRFAVHNHAREFAAMDGQVIYDIILAGTDPTTVFFELDLFWITKGGADPDAYLAKHGDRFFSCHMKGMTPDGAISGLESSVLDLPRMIDAAQSAGVRHFYVEYDKAPNPIQDMQQAYRYLASLP